MNCSVRILRTTSIALGTFALLTTLASARAAPATGEPLTTQDAKLLLDVERVANWKGEQVDLARGVCTAAKYQGPWSADGATYDAGSEDRLHKTWDSCGAGRGSSPPFPSLSPMIADFRAALQREVVRLARSHAALGTCRTQVHTDAFAACLATAFGRPATEQELLLALKVLSHGS